MTVTDVSLDELLNFNIAPVCEHSNHIDLHNDEPAKYKVRVTCPACPDVAVYILCPSGLALMKREVLECKCGEIYKAFQFLWVLQEL